MASARSSSAYAFAPASMDAPREVLLHQAKKAQAEGRFGDVVRIIHGISMLSPDLTQDEHDLLTSTYGHIVYSKHSFMVKLIWMEVHEVDIAVLEEIKTCRKSIQSELENFYTSAIDHLKKYLIPSSVGTENNVFYQKLEGDFYWLLAELQSGSERMLLYGNSLKAYEIAEELAKRNLPPANRTRLLVAHNYSKFYTSIAGPCERSLEIVKEALVPALVVPAQTWCSDSEVLLEHLKESMIIYSVDIAIKTEINEIVNGSKKVLVFKLDDELEEKTSAVVKSYLTPYEQGPPAPVRRLAAPPADEDAFVSPPSYMPAESAKDIRARRKLSSCSRGRMG